MEIKLPMLIAVGRRSDEKAMNCNHYGCFIKLFENYDGEKLIEELKQYLSENEL